MISIELALIACFVSLCVGYAIAPRVVNEG